MYTSATSAEHFLSWRVQHLSRNKVSYTSSSTTRRVGKESFLIKQQRPPPPPFPQWRESSQDSGGNMTVGAFETAVCRERSQEPASL